MQIHLPKFKTKKTNLYIMEHNHRFKNKTKRVIKFALNYSNHDLTLNNLQILRFIDVKRC